MSQSLGTDRIKDYQDWLTCGRCGETQCRCCPVCGASLFDFCDCYDAPAEPIMLCPKCGENDRIRCGNADYQSDGEWFDEDYAECKSCGHVGDPQLFEDAALAPPAPQPELPRPVNHRKGNQ